MDEYLEYERDNDNWNEICESEIDINQHTDYICDDYESMYPILPSMTDENVELFRKTFLNQSFSGVTEERGACREGHGERINQVTPQHFIAPKGKVGVPAARNMDVADEYLLRRYGERALSNLKPDGKVDLPLLKPPYWVEVQEGKDEGGSRGETKTKTRTQTKNDRKKRLWTGIDHFTRCDDLYVMDNQQLQICKYFDTMCDKVEEEKSRVEEEVTREVMRETHLGMLGKRRKIKKKGCKEGGEKERLDGCKRRRVR